MKSQKSKPMPLEGIKIIDISTLFAGPFLATILSDYGAEVIKVEHPKGDPARGHGHQKNGVPLWWKMLNRNKDCITLYLGNPKGQELFLRLIADADVLIENFRPGTLEKWNLGWDRLRKINPGLILTRVTGFGQFGPYAKRPGFGTIAESMSGFAYITGEPDGPPTLPPFGLADGITALTGASAVAFALYHRDVHNGSGQVIDLAIIEPILSILGPQPTVYDQLGVVQTRTGNRSVNNAPRNTYKTRDGSWVAISTSAQSIAERVMRLVGHPEVIDEPWFASGKERAQHADELDKMVSDWIVQRDLEDVIEQFEKNQAAISPIYDIKQIMTDPQYKALNSIITIEDDELGPIKMQNVLFRLSETPGQIKSTGKPLGADNNSVYKNKLGLLDTEIEELRKNNVI